MKKLFVAHRDKNILKAGVWQKERDMWLLVEKQKLDVVRTLMESIV